MSGLYLLWLITAWSNVENRISYPDDLVDESSRPEHVPLLLLHYEIWNFRGSKRCYDLYFRGIMIDQLKHLDRYCA